MAATGTDLASVPVMEADGTRAANLTARLRYPTYEPVVAACPEALGRIEPAEGIALMFGETRTGGIESSFEQLLHEETPYVGSMA